MRTLVKSPQKDTFTLDDVDQHNMVYVVSGVSVLILIKRIYISETERVWAPITLCTGSDSSWGDLHGSTAAECIANFLAYFVEYHYTQPVVTEYTPDEYRQRLSERWNSIK
ncbi:hypothetical protein LCGC14_2436580 [marine sediment metagenome]|uniref:Uncharacterized protein n=1 Tax=marine sediment metagenome TaxID=412755 RepID=A0A0F9BK98_9ZZZZ